ncbi:MAG: 1-deoxy-D-xylulose-5-phosphate reductoisomerase, partial [Lachnospiraceae bacterium]|nr:1-deoxy-D-xylulose-5-phosphate reductoisomerase [Lachnospiraceae bacterium]
MARNIVILGSTGSIGTQALSVVREHADALRVVALAANKNVALLEEQIRAYRPEACAMYDEDAARDLRTRISDLDVKVYGGMEGLITLATIAGADTVLTSLVGMIGIRPTIAAIEAGKDIALANKETLVAAGEIIMPLVKKHGVKLLPVDSEHSAIFQCLNGEPADKIEEILLTASGGPFRGKKRDALEHVRKEDALKHPNWAMGAKITIDSATLVNKGLEVIEAMHLFQVKPSQVHVLVQPQSIIHSMVRFVDGSVIAQLGLPDMKLPIQYAFFYPERAYMTAERLSFEKLQCVTFEAPDTETFRGLQMAFDCAETGGTMPAVFNA